MRYIVVMIDPEDADALTIETDDVFETVESIIAAGYDIGADEGMAEEVTIELTEGRNWPSDDGSRMLVLIDTQSISYSKVLG